MRRVFRKIFFPAFAFVVGFIVFAWQGGWWSVTPACEWTLAGAKLRPVASALGGSAIIVADCNLSETAQSSNVALKVVSLQTGRINESLAVPPLKTKPQTAGAEYDGDHLIVSLNPVARSIYSHDFAKREWRSVAVNGVFDFTWPKATALSPEGKLFYATGDGENWWAIDVATGRAKIVLTTPPSRRVRCDDGRHVLLTDESLGTLQVWSLEDGKLKWKKALDKEFVLGIDADRWGKTVRVATLAATSDSSFASCFAGKTYCFSITEGTLLAELCCPDFETAQTAPTVIEAEQIDVALDRETPNYGITAIASNVSKFGQKPSDTRVIGIDLRTMRATSPIAIGAIVRDLQDDSRILCIDSQTLCVHNLSKKDVTQEPPAWVLILPESWQNFALRVCSVLGVSAQYRVHFVDLHRPDPPLIRRFLIPGNRIYGSLISSDGKYLIIADMPKNEAATRFRCFALPFAVNWISRLPWTLAATLGVFLARSLVRRLQSRQSSSPAVSQNADLLL